MLYPRYGILPRTTIVEMEGKYCLLPGIHAIKRQKDRGAECVLSVLFYVLSPCYLMSGDDRLVTVLCMTVRKYLPVSWGRGKVLNSSLNILCFAL